MGEEVVLVVGTGITVVVTVVLVAGMGIPVAGTVAAAGMVVFQAALVCPTATMLRMTGVIIGATPPTKITAIVVVVPVILQHGAFTTCLSTSRIG